MFNGSTSGTQNPEGHKSTSGTLPPELSATTPASSTATDEGQCDVVVVL